MGAGGPFEHAEAGQTGALRGTSVRVLGLFSASDFPGLLSFSAPKISEAFRFGGSFEDIIADFGDVKEALGVC
jgi:hypothetical protein